MDGQPFYDLHFKCDMENIAELVPDQDEIRFYMKVRCSNCGEENEKWVYVDPKVFRSLSLPSPLTSMKGRD